MVQTGTLAGTRTVALLTSMEEPLGRFSGNWIEVWECVDIMQASNNQARHPLSRDLIQLTNILCGWMLHLAGQADTPAAGAALSDEILQSGAAYQAWLKIVAAHHGATSIFKNPAAFHKPAITCVLKAEASGYLASMDCTAAGWAVQRLGAGRAQPGDPVSAHAGIEMHVKLGDRVEPNQPLITLFSEDPSRLTEPYEMLRATLQFTPTPPALQPLIREIITANP
jgi:pyrimidine-nucleoside phosphorylase